ncbi:MAG TPA: helix-turn-helix transcriptional regulator [Allosphingosinicella sp.]|nr:helix-turn-helix transcriptional regulator [Allosphingosinicella sp.]
MDPHRIARLTEQQRTCLRFVYRHMTSKEIAPLMGIEPGSVDQHIKAAMRTLGVGDRRSAARILAEHDAAQGIQPLVYQPSDIAVSPDSSTFGPPIESGWQPSGLSGGAMREEQASFRVATSGGAPTLPLPIGTARPHDLSWLARLGWIFAIMLMIALTFGVFLAGVEALSRIGRTASF